MENVEIERKFLVKELPADLEAFPRKDIEQAYLCTDPVVRVRRSNDKYTLTYKGRGLLERSEYNLPLTKEAYEKLVLKAEGIVISKKRYLLPLDGGLTAELDCFLGRYKGLFIVEVEFGSTAAAHAFIPPSWFGKEVTDDPSYHNSSLSAG